MVKAIGLSWFDKDNTAFAFLINEIDAAEPGGRLEVVGCFYAVTWYLHGLVSVHFSVQHAV